MKSIWRSLWLAAFVVPAVDCPASAGSWAKSPLGQAEFGKVWSGESFETGDLAGDVVLLVWWTDAHSDSKRVLSDVALLGKELSGSGAVIVCVALYSDKDKSVGMAKQAKVSFPVVGGVRLPEPDKPKYAPSYTVFDRDGQVAFHTAQRQAQSVLDAVEMRMAILDAVRREPLALMVDPREYHEKDVVRLAKRAAKGTGLGKLLGRIEETLADGTEAQKAEGGRLQKELLDYAQRMCGEAAKMMADRPHRHFDIHRELAKSFRGHKFGETSQSLYESIKSDPRRMDEIAASRLVERLATAAEKDKKSIYRKIKRKYAETEIGRRALADADAE